MSSSEKTVNNLQYATTRQLADPPQVGGRARDETGVGPVSYTHLTLPTSDLV